MMRIAVPVLGCAAADRFRPAPPRGRDKEKPAEPPKEETVRGLRQQDQVCQVNVDNKDPTDLDLLTCCRTSNT